MATRVVSPLHEQRHLGLVGATGVGVSAIVGGGILALAGAALASAGPSAILAFALNGLVALLTALSFAEMASKFPESGGAYTFAKKVLSIEAAFTVGWVVWFASIAAVALYALGFAHFALIMISNLWSTWENPPLWLAASATETGLAVVATALVAIGLVLKRAGGGQWVNIGKVVVFGILILGGFWAIGHRSLGELQTRMQPFFSGGLPGLLQAMGFTFIAMQGFDLIAAVGGEVRSPARNIPRAMILSLLIALAVYLPLLFVVATAGTVGDRSITDMAGRDPEAVIAQAAYNYLGPFGYWLVIVAAVLAMISALQANLYAASRIARAMARDRTLPSPLRWIGPKRRTPYVAIAVTAAIAVILMLVLPNVPAAGAASSLIFLVTFALVHWTAILVRQRSADQPPPFRVPGFPIVPVIGGASCLTLAVLQSLFVPSAGIVACVWLILGGGMFLTLYAQRARVHDAVSTALNPELVRLRGHSPTVLVPIANPRHAAAMVELAHTLTPTAIGRLVVLSVVVAPEDWRPAEDSEPFVPAQSVLRQAITAAIEQRIHIETVMTAAREPVAEIARVANRVQSDLVVLGLSHISREPTGTPGEGLLSSVPGDVVALRAPAGWRMSDVSRILVLVAGQGGHDQLRARLLGSLMRTGRREVTFLRVVCENATSEEIRLARRDVTHLIADEMLDMADVVIEPAADVVSVAVRHTQSADLVVLGVQRVGSRRLFGSFTRRLATQSSCPMVVISRR